MARFALLRRLRLARGPIQGLILCGALLITAIALGTALITAHFRDRTITSNKRELQNTVLLVARHFDQRFADLQGIQNDVLTYMNAANIHSGAAYRSLMSGMDVHRLLRVKLSSLPYVGGINLFDADGKLINSSETWPVPDLGIGDRPHFQTLKARNGPQTVQAEPVTSRVTGAWTAVFARKLLGRNGEFLGVISRGVEPVHFENFFASLALGQDARILMLHRNGTVLARYPRDETVIGQNLSDSPVFQQLWSTAGTVSGRYISPIDGEDELGAARPLTDAPIMVVATTSMAAALHDWREQTRYQIIGALLAVLVIAVILILIVRQLNRQHRLAAKMLAVKSRHLDTAVSNMTQGLLLFDSNARLAICNRRFIEMFGLSDTIVRPGCTLRDLIQHRKDTGSFVGDVDVYCTSFKRNVDEGNFSDMLATPDGRCIQILVQRSADGGWASTLEDVTERIRAEARIAHLAHYDALTDLPNRVMLRQRLEAEIATLQHGAQFAILYIDIDEFKSINDTLGHAVGDELLKIVAERLRGSVGDKGFVARLGGDEFAIVLPGIRHRDDVTRLVAPLHEAIRWPYVCFGNHITTDASIGIALAPDDGTDLDELLRHADLAMYGAKGAGRRTYRFFERVMDEGAKARRVLEQDLRRALMQGDGLEVHYQPVLDIASNDITGCEALVRWRHPLRGMISPAEFIPVAEATGLIDELGDWVLQRACIDAASWPAAINLAVNVSPLQFASQALALKVAGALAASGLSASRLELEVTETVLIRDDELALATLHQLRDIGVRIALDDFGTGYSSLSYLQRFPFDKVKIDRCFIRGVAAPGGAASIVQAVVTIAAALNMETTAEGVETPEQLDALRRLGCTQMQGFLFSAAKPSQEIRALLQARHAAVA